MDMGYDKIGADFLTVRKVHFITWLKFPSRYTYNLKHKIPADFLKTK